jgi:nuclear pore complex protein Nup155
VPRILPSILRLRAPDPLKQVLVDEYRCTMYTRSEAGAVTVYDLGPGCGEAPRKVADCRDVAQAAVLARGGGGLFYQGGGAGGGGMGGGAGAGGGASQAQRGRRLVHLAVVSPAESVIVTLVAVCADGRRVYFTTLPAAAERLGFPGMGGGGNPNAHGGYNNPNGSIGSGGGGGGGSGGGGAQRLVPASCRLAVVQSREPIPQGSA